jgi:hypothetical protein
MKNIILFAAIIGTLLSACSKSAAPNEKLNGQSGAITRFTVSGNYLYALDQNKILTFYLSQNDDPKLVNEIATDYGLETITIYENVVYIGSRTGLYILDISNAAAPIVLSKSERDPVLRNGCDPVAIKGDYAYSTVKIIERICGRAGSQSVLETYDVKDKQNPRMVNQQIMNQPNGLAILNDKLLICDEGIDAVVIADISVPQSPRFFNQINLAKPNDIIISYNRAIISTKTGFSIYDLSDFNNIRLLSAIAK